MTRWGTLLTCLCTLLAFNPQAAAENMSIGIGADGNFYLIDGRPQLEAGVGGHIYFDYRFAPQLAAMVSTHVTTEDGKGITAADGDILFFAIPSIDFKYYLFSSSGRFDPYAMLGVGFYLVSEGSQRNGTMAVGFGANAGLGFDFYISPALSANANVAFRSIGLIDAPSGANNGSGLFPLTTSGGLAFHF
jgi:hypothetical protein